MDHKKSPAEREVTFRARPRALLVAVAAAFAPTLAAPAVAHAVGTKATLTVGSGETVEVSATTKLSSLTIEEGGVLAAPDGYSISLTVNSVETGSELALLTDGYGGAATAIAAGTYSGTVVITVAEANEVAYSTLTFPFRQAIYVDSDGVDKSKSVLANVKGGSATNTAATGIRLTSTGEAFNGVYVTGGGTYTLKNAKIAFTGNGRCDFIGYGASVVGTGDGTTLVVNGATITNQGVVRTAVIADATANVIVKNSTIHTADGTVPDEYPASGTGDTKYMITVPWMLGLSGNVRATNLLGANTRAAYINSSVSSENWGALSVDGGSNCTLTVINSTIANTGGVGYGSYAIGNVTEHILGSTYDVGDYVLITWSGTVHYGDSVPGTVSDLNDSLELGLTSTELSALSEKSCALNSGRFGFMWYGASTVTIDGGTQVSTEKTTFLSKASAATVVVDGSDGATIEAGNGVIFQLMDTDRPSSVSVSGEPWSSETIGTYTEPTGSATKSSSWVTTSAQTGDSTATFTDIALTGNFYNSVWGGGNASIQGQNLVLTFDGSTVEGVISASAAKHSVSTITSAEYLQIGEVTNTAQAVVNNGVIVTLKNGADWTVTGTSYLSALTIASDASVTAPSGKTVTLTVGGTTTTITPGKSYTGALTLTVA
ncbi:hypothetical protein [Streptomyces lutosisoli]|uniref:Uncharacterized protein n=1 Tax=Streptomyces lutosisoli TaxID=2665721 RepID=A0ABW2W1E8_9ACTN